MIAQGGEGEEMCDWRVCVVSVAVQQQTDVEMAWQGLFLFTEETVIHTDHVVFPCLHKGYAIASSPHDTMNEPPLLEPETLVRSVIGRYLQVVNTINA